MTVAGPVVENGTSRRPHAVAPGRRPPITLSPLAAPPEALFARVPPPKSDDGGRTVVVAVARQTLRVGQLPRFWLCRWMSSSSVAGGARGRPAGGFPAERPPRPRRVGVPEGPRGLEQSLNTQPPRLCRVSGGCATAARGGYDWAPPWAQTPLWHRRVAQAGRPAGGYRAGSTDAAGYKSARHGRHCRSLAWSAHRRRGRHRVRPCAHPADLPARTLRTATAAGRASGAPDPPTAAGGCG